MGSKAMKIIRNFNISTRPLYSMSNSKPSFPLKYIANLSSWELQATTPTGWKLIGSFLVYIFTMIHHKDEVEDKEIEILEKGGVVVDEDGPLSAILEEQHLHTCQELWDQLAEQKVFIRCCTDRQPGQFYASVGGSLIFRF